MHKAMAAFLAMMALAAPASAQQAVQAPFLSMEEAVKTARDCAEEKQADTSHAHLTAAIYESALQKNDAGEKRRWALRWSPDRAVKGGGFAVFLYEDGRCDIGHGE